MDVESDMEPELRWLLHGISMNEISPFDISSSIVCNRPSVDIRFSILVAVASILVATCRIFCVEASILADANVYQIT